MRVPERGRSGAGVGGRRHGADPADPADTLDILGRVEVASPRLVEEVAGFTCEAHRAGARVLCAVRWPFVSQDAEDLHKIDECERAHARA